MTNLPADPLPIKYSSSLSKSELLCVRPSARSRYGRRGRYSDRARGEPILRAEVNAGSGQGLISHERSIPKCRRHAQVLCWDPPTRSHGRITTCQESLPMWQRSPPPPLVDRGMPNPYEDPSPVFRSRNSSLACMVIAPARSCRSAFDEGQEVGVHDVRMSRAEPVRQPLVDLESPMLQEFDG